MRIRLIILVALGVFLVWGVVTRGVAAYLAEASPEKAIRLRATQATALLNLAEKKLRDLDPKKVEPATNSKAVNEDTRPAEVQSQQSFDTAGQNSPLSAPSDGSRTQTRDEVRSLAERALVEDPLNARAFQILGQLSVQASDDTRAETFMHAAVRRSLFASEAVYWMMQKSYKVQNYKAALGYAVVLLKTTQRTGSYVMPILGNIAEKQDAATELKKLLANNPAWRQGFFVSLPNNISDARTPLAIFLSLKDTAAPPTATELRSYLNFLVDRKLYDLAYYTWLQFLPAEQLNKVGNLFNGGFEAAPSGVPFDWVWTDKPGATIEIAVPPDRENERALHIEFGPGRVDFSGVTQLIILPPGSYQFRGGYQADIVSQRGLQWRITCAGAEGSPLGESSLVSGRDSAWQDLEVSFTVPNANCPAQYVTLASGARSASEQFMSGTVWYDNLKIVNESVVVPSKNPS